MIGEKVKILFPAVFFLALTAWCGNSTIASAETVVRTSGSGFGLGVMKHLAESYEKAHPGIRIEVLPSLGSSGGIKALLQGSLDFSVSGRPLQDAEKTKGGIATELAMTPFVFIVHGKVDKREITTGELEKIYSGLTTAWPDGTRIRLVLRPMTEADTKIIESLSPTMERAVASAMSRDGMIFAVTDQECAEAVEKTPGALGGSTMTQLLTEKRDVNILRFNNIKPSVSGIQDGSYPLVKTLYLVTTPKTPAAARQFIEFISSKRGGNILREYGCAPVKTRQGKSLEK